MNRRRVLQFYASFFLFVAAVALIHLGLRPSITGFAVASGPSASVLSGFALSLFVIALIFFFIAVRRFVPREVIRRIELRDIQSSRDFDS